MATAEVGMRIGELREEQGLTPSQLAERLKVDESQLVRLERGEEPVTTKMLLRIAEVLDVKSVRFFEGWPGEEQPAGEVTCPKCGHRFRAVAQK